MEHITVKAVLESTEEEVGVFEAVVSTASIDRDKDVVDPSGMVRALHRWGDRKIPLAWHHDVRDPESIIGFVDGSSALETGGEVQVEGWIDRSTEKGKHAWRLAKQAGILGLSYGFMPTASTNRKGGGRHISELDIFEVTLTVTPVNRDTRILATKALNPWTADPRNMVGYGEEDLGTRAARVAVELEPVKIKIFEC